MRTLITGGTVISMDPVIGDLDRGDVLIENDVIVDVAERIDASDAVVIDASDRVVMPGFVDTHRHTWQTAFRGVGADWTFAEYLVAVHGTLKPHYQPEDVYLGNLLGRLEALHSGVTTMLDWFHCGRTPDHVDAGTTASQHRARSRAERPPRNDDRGAGRGVLRDHAVRPGDRRAGACDRHGWRNPRCRHHQDL